MIDNQWIIDEYDRAVLNGGLEGSQYRDTRAEVIDSIVHAVHTGQMSITDVPVEMIAEWQFDSVIKPVRNSRRKSLKVDGEWLLAILNGETIMGDLDPVLDRAYGLGKSDGLDKSLRFWLAEDWQNAARERYRNAADVMEAARDFDVNIAAPIADLMRSRSVRMTGELVADIPVEVAS